jgi:undecaprenyl-diphosphatase
VVHRPVAGDSVEQQGQDGAARRRAARAARTGAAAADAQVEAAAEGTGIIGALAEAALLGVVQGLTEFLPVSSSAHLILARLFFRFDAEKFGLAFDVAIHIGTLVAVLAYFHRDLRALLGSLPHLLTPGRAVSGEHVPIERQDVRAGAEGARLIWLIVIGTLPAVVVGLLFGDAIERSLRTPEVAAVMLILGSIGFFAAERLGTQRRNEESLTAAEALLIGCAQAAALVPGISRSGATITIALFLGLRRAEAARYTFLLGIPAIVGAAVLKFPDMLDQGVGAGGGSLFAIGIASSAVVGYLAVKYFIRFLAKHSLDVFAWYRLALAALTVVWVAVAAA